MLSKEKPVSQAPSESTQLLLHSRLLAKDAEAVSYESIQHMSRQRELLEGAQSHVRSNAALSERIQRTLREIESWSQKRICLLWTAMILLFIANVALVVRLITNEGDLFR